MILKIEELESRLLDVAAITLDSPTRERVAELCRRGLALVADSEQPFGGFGADAVARAEEAVRTSASLTNERDRMRSRDFGADSVRPPSGVDQEIVWIDDHEWASLRVPAELVRSYLASLSIPVDTSVLRKSLRTMSRPPEDKRALQDWVYRAAAVTRRHLADETAQRLRSWGQDRN